MVNEDYPPSRLTRCTPESRTDVSGTGRKPPAEDHQTPDRGVQHLGKVSIMCPASLALIVSLALPTSYIPFDSTAPMYVVDSSRRLLTVNVLTGETDLIGSTDAQLTDIAFGHDGLLYGVNARYLYGIDAETGGTTLIGDHGYGEFGAGFGIDSLTFGDDGVLYAAGDDILISIDPLTGAGTTIGTLSGHQSSGDLAADATGRLLLTTDLGDFVEVYRDGTGAELVGRIPDVDVYAFAANGDGELYGIRSTGAIVNIDGATGQSTVVSTLNADFPIGAAWGGSFADQYVPEPTTLLLILTGAALCLRRLGGAPLP